MFTASLRLGGLVARADEKHVDALSEFGQNLGLAFQITDDLLDARSISEDNGKQTFPALLGVEQSRRRAEQAVAEAINALALFGDKAETMIELARFVSQRGCEVQSPESRVQSH